MTATADETFAAWVVLELMGHRRLAGFLTEQQIGGASFLRIDVPSDPPVTQMYSPSAVYAITPCTEETARKAANISRVAPVSQWELPPAPIQMLPVDDDDEPDDCFDCGRPDNECRCP